MLVTSASARPIQGVSQQPAKIRNEGQCSQQDNMVPSVVDGLKKRAGTLHVAQIMNSVHPDAKIHHYRRGATEEYFIVIEPGPSIRVFGTDGTEHIVNITSGSGYLNVSNPRTGLKCQTISDFTFIVNKNKAVSMRADKSPALVNEAMVYCQFATYGRTYQIKFNGIVVAEYETPDGSVPSHIEQVDTTFVTSQFMSGSIWTDTNKVGNLQQAYDSEGAYYYGDCYITIPAPNKIQFVKRNDSNTVISPTSISTVGATTTINFPDGWRDIPVTVYYQTPSAGGLTLQTDYVCTQDGNTIHIKRADGAPFSVTTVDGADGKDLIAVKEYIRELSQLPPKAPDGFMIEMKPQGSNALNSYWLRATETVGNHVKWVEAVAPDTELGFDKSTMPVNLIRQSIDGNGVATFELAEGAWKDRAVGDDNTNPLPSFIDKSAPTTIRSIGLAQNRLFFTTGEAVVMSRGDGDFFNFFRESTQTEADTDPIDVYADSNQVNYLDHNASMDGDFVFFSDSAQFILPGDKPLTKENATLRQVSAFESISEATPVAAGENIFFAFSYGEYTGIREFFTDSQSDTKRANPITEHVQKYLIGQARMMASSTNQDWLFVLTEGARNVVYVYNWLWLGDQKVQSAWHRWVFHADEVIQHVEVNLDRVYFIISRPEGVFLEYLPIGDRDDSGVTYPVRLDRRHTATATKVAEYYEFPDTFPDEEEANLEYIMSTGGFEEDKGTSITFERIGGMLRTYDELTADGSPCTLIGGRRYLSVYQPNLPVVKDFKDRVIGTDRLTVSRMILNYERTGSVTVLVEDAWGTVRSYEFNGRVIGGSNNTVGFAELLDGQHKFPVYQRADRVTITIQSDSPLPLQLRDLEWAGQFNQRGQRI